MIIKTRHIFSFIILKFCPQIDELWSITKSSSGWLVGCHSPLCGYVVHKFLKQGLLNGLLWSFHPNGSLRGYDQIARNPKSTQRPKLFYQMTHDNLFRCIMHDTSSMFRESTLAIWKLWKVNDIFRCLCFIKWIHKGHQASHLDGNKENT